MNQMKKFLNRETHLVSDLPLATTHVQKENCDSPETLLQLDIFDPFSVLGLRIPLDDEGFRSFSPQEITRAYYKKALTFHPDKRPVGAPEAYNDLADSCFAVVSKAKELLLDPGIQSACLQCVLYNAKKEEKESSSKLSKRQQAERREQTVVDTLEALAVLFLQLEKRNQQRQQQQQRQGKRMDELFYNEQRVEIVETVTEVDDIIEEEVEEETEEIQKGHGVVGEDKTEAENCELASTALVSVPTSSKQLILTSPEYRATAPVINKVALRDAGHYSNQMPHKKDRHQKGERQRKAQRKRAEERLRKDAFAFTGKIRFQDKNPKKQEDEETVDEAVAMSNSSKSSFFHWTNRNKPTRLEMLRRREKKQRKEQALLKELELERNKVREHDEEEEEECVEESEFILLDGTLGTGGGQLIRNSLAYAAVLGLRLRIVNPLASKRELQPAHKTAIATLMSWFGGYNHPSTESQSSGEHYAFAHTTDGQEYIPETEEGHQLREKRTLSSFPEKGNGEVVFDGETTGLVYGPNSSTKGVDKIDVGSAGSVTLVCQCLLPVILFFPFPVTLHIKGGTNVRDSPDVDYLSLVWCPLVSKFFGGEVEVELKRRGMYPKGGGSVVVRSKPLEGGVLQPIHLTSVGFMETILIRTWLTGKMPYSVAQRVSQAALKVIRSKYPEKESSVKIDMEIVKEDGGLASKVGCFVVGVSSTGARWGGSSHGGKGTRAEAVGTRAAKEMMENYQKGGGVDGYMQDQLIVLMALASGVSSLRIPSPLSLHTSTAILVAERLTGARFDLQKTAVKETLRDKSILLTCTGVSASSIPLRTLSPFNPRLQHYLLQQTLLSQNLQTETLLSPETLHDPQPNEDTEQPPQNQPTENLREELSANNDVSQH
eukprot:CAMPEP_0174263766 /NCGR_PEP_ID=MMETSP0439-20130205/19931_1 /TAXON_ID=0 /ORGANISM="Stereomyxa ramosa, Strain Chinc5" /LENGTH=885 /DNA_ID=CAMNT_0015349303 /DNA_START=72 /DNA_END=2729 /DNA_ORIENTATION=+